MLSDEKIYCIIFWSPFCSKRFRLIIFKMFIFYIANPLHSCYCCLHPDHILISASSKQHLTILFYPDLYHSGEGFSSGLFLHLTTCRFHHRTNPSQREERRGYKRRRGGEKRRAGKGTSYASEYLTPIMFFTRQWPLGNGYLVIAI